MTPNRIVSHCCSILAIEAAFDDARDKAKILAVRAGRALGQALIVTEGDLPIPQPMFARAMEADFASVPTEPGLETLTFSVSAVFDLD